MQITVNATGLELVAAWLSDHHIQGADHGHLNVHAWASDIEQHAADGNGAYFELRAHESLCGRPEIFELPSVGYDVAAEEEQD